MNKRIAKKQEKEMKTSIIKSKPMSYKRIKYMLSLVNGKLRDTFNTIGEWTLPTYYGKYYIRNSIISNKYKYRFYLHSCSKYISILSSDGDCYHRYISDGHLVITPWNNDASGKWMNTWYATHSDIYHNRRYQFMKNKLGLK